MLFAFARKFHLSLSLAACLIAPLSAFAENVAIIGGIDLTGSGPAYAALVSASGTLTPLALPGDAATGGIINSVSMNASENSLIGGQGQSAAAYAALVSSLEEVTPLTFSGGLEIHGVINGAAINASGNGIIGGRDTTGPVYAALVPSSGNPIVPLTFPSPVSSGGIINTVSINASGNSLVGGQVLSGSLPAYAASVSSSGEVTSLTLTGGITTTGNILSVSINDSGNGIIGGRDLTGAEPGYVALVSSSGDVTSLTLTGGVATTGEIRSVAINASGSSIIGGQDSTGGQPGYAAFVSPSGTITPLTLTGGVSTNGTINSVAINASGNGIIGGQDLTGGQPAFAALVSASGTVTPLVLGTDMDTSGIIYSVAISSEGNGILGGWNLTGSQPGFAALFSSSGTVIPLTLTGGITTNGWINGVAWMESTLPLLTKIPTASLSGNNLTFASYINEFAPDDAFYFIPSELDGTLNSALQSAAPTRNGVSTYTANNNLFFLTTSFANHIRNQQSESFLQPKESIAVSGHPLPYKELTASLSESKKVEANTSSLIWFEMVGALAYQKSQEQTVGFNPTTGGAILGFDHKIIPHLRIGGGVSYLFTHIHEKEGQGHSNINQEDAFIYGSWDHRHFYVDMLVMGGAFQTAQVRKIKMTGFSFSSTSHPNGWQLLPHVELGFKRNISSGFYLTPFGMVDLANAWQGSYKEKGNGPFNVSQKSYYGSLLRTEAGLRFYETLFFKSWNFSLEEKVSYVNTQSFGGGKVNAFLVGSPGSFTVETLSSAQNLGVAQVAMTFAPLNGKYPISTLFYQGEFGSQYQSHQLNLELGWKF